MSGDVHRAEGWKVPAATMVKNAVSVPVVATGSIRHPDFVDQIINDGKCDMVGMGRGILAEREWVKKCAEGREDELRYCISCMNCFNVNPFSYEQTNCSVNPFALREGSKRPIVQDGTAVWWRSSAQAPRAWKLRSRSNSAALTWWCSTNAMRSAVTSMLQRSPLQGQI